MLSACRLELVASDLWLLRLDESCDRLLDLHALAAHLLDVGHLQKLSFAAIGLLSVVGLSHAKTRAIYVMLFRMISVFFGNAKGNVLFLRTHLLLQGGHSTRECIDRLHIVLMKSSCHTMRCYEYSDASNSALPSWPLCSLHSPYCAPCMH